MYVVPAVELLKLQVADVIATSVVNPNCPNETYQEEID